MFHDDDDYDEASPRAATEASGFCCRIPVLASPEAAATRDPPPTIPKP